MNDGMVQLNKVTKAYGSFQLDCSMEVQPGMATGFVGANGAGKTTTFQILLGLVPPETGEIRIFGKPYTELTAKDRERIGVSLADSDFSQFLTVRDVTAILRNLYTRFDETRFLEKCQRYELPANKKIKDFSTGMQAKLKLLIATSHDADLLILDDLNAERDTSFMQEIVFTVIDNRCAAQKPLIVTSNITPSEFANPDTIERRRVFSRLQEVCIPVEVNGKDRRREAMMKSCRDDLAFLNT